MLSTKIYLNWTTFLRGCGSTIVNMSGLFRSDCYLLSSAYMIYLGRAKTGLALTISYSTPSEAFLATIMHGNMTVLVRIATEPGKRRIKYRTTDNDRQAVFVAEGNAPS